jgi:hypothetical protein
MSKSSSVKQVSILAGGGYPGAHFKEREIGLNYNMNEMHDFFLKHYSDGSESYNEKLKHLNIRFRVKT